MFDVRDPPSHAYMKKQVASLYTMTALVSYEDSVNEQTAFLKTKMGQFADQGEVIDLTQFLQYYAFDVIGAITVGICLSLCPFQTYKFSFTFFFPILL